MSNEIAKPFVWKSSKSNGGGEFLVTDMVSRHLFYTWLMIWNHSAPVELQIKEGKCSKE